MCSKFLVRQFTCSHIQRYMLNEQKRTGTDEETTGEEMSSFHLHHCIGPGILHGPGIEGLETRPRFRLVGSNIDWWHVPRRCWQYERRPMKVTVRLPSTFAELAARSPDRPSQSYVHRPGERCARASSRRYQ